MNNLGFMDGCRQVQRRNRMPTPSVLSRFVASYRSRSESATVDGGRVAHEGTRAIARALDANPGHVVGVHVYRKPLRDRLARASAAVLKRDGTHHFLVLHVFDAAFGVSYLLLESHINGISADSFATSDTLDAYLSRADDVSTIVTVDVPMRPVKELSAFVQSWPSYDILANNCQHFVEAVLSVLLPGREPTTSPPVLPEPTFVGVAANMFFADAAASRAGR
jgi:hypothetical protein